MQASTTFSNYELSRDGDVTNAEVFQGLNARNQYARLLVFVVPQLPVNGTCCHREMMRVAGKVFAGRKYSHRTRCSQSSANQLVVR